MVLLTHILAGVIILKLQKIKCSSDFFLQNRAFVIFKNECFVSLNTIFSVQYPFLIQKLFHKRLIIPCVEKYCDFFSHTFFFFHVFFSYNWCYLSGHDNSVCDFVVQTSTHRPRGRVHFVARNE